MRPGRNYHSPEPGMLLISVLAADPGPARGVLPALAAEFGPLDFISHWLDFSHSRYYTGEMGDGLGRYLLFFERPLARENLVAAKIFCDRLEAIWAGDRGRRVNLDPGYLALDHLILASTKAVPHRPYLGRGIYADLTLVFESGGYIPLRWTYPDYADAAVRRLCGEMRDKILRRRKEHDWLCPVAG